MRCKNCGRDLPRDAAFCPECGERTFPRAAEEVMELAGTSGLIRGGEADSVPDAPEPPEIPDDVPEIPDAAALPDGPSAGGGTAEAALDVSLVSSIDKARIREEARRAAQALVEYEQAEPEEQVEQAPEKSSPIADRGYELERVYPTEEPPPPPPAPGVEERMWEDTVERARQHGIEIPGGEQEPEYQWQKDERAIGEKLASAVEQGDKGCCAYGCIALFILLFLLFVVGFIMNVVQ